MSVLKQESVAQGKERRRRRIWSDEEKRRIVAETFKPASVSIVARRHDLNANQLFTWRRNDPCDAIDCRRRSDEIGAGGGHC